MLLPIKWLKEYVDIGDMTPAELSDKLISCGFEIEGITDLSASIKNVVVGKIISIEKHPNADKLQICQIDIGEERMLQIITGAHNIAVGDVVPVCKDGAVLPGGKEIRTGELRGIVSEGMLCGGSELGLTEHDYPNAGVDGILILDSNARIGEDINVEIGNDDVVLDVSITANRTDANSIYSLARETAAVLNLPLKPLDLDYSIGADGNVSDDIAVNNMAEDLCQRYIAAEVKDVKIVRSPRLIANRLRAVGIRPINSIVDITNYVLTEIGQPMHAFDLRAIEGGTIVVRRAESEEKILALDGKEYKLCKDNLVIANAKAPMAVAGVMGGEGFSILDDTKDIVFESARFSRDNVRKTSRALNLRSDSSARFEKGIDFYAQECGMKRALALIDKYGFGKIVNGMVDNFPVKPEEKRIVFTEQDIAKILGITVPEADILRILNSLTIPTVKNRDYSSEVAKVLDMKEHVSSSKRGGKLTATIPAYREDIYGVNDLAEEIIRMYGYDKITASVTPQNYISVGGKNNAQKLTDKVKNVLVGRGFSEIITYSFITPKAFDLLTLSEDNPLRNCIRIINPLGEDFSVMRTTLAHSMIKTLATNATRGNKVAKLFEIAKAYIPKSLPLTEYPIEKETLAVGAYGTDFYSFKADLEDMLNVFYFDAKFERATVDYMHPTRTANIIDRATGEVIGYMGEVSDLVADNYGTDKRLYFAELDISYILAHARLYAGFKVVSKYQPVERDLAVVCKRDVEAETLLGAVKSACSELLLSVKVFDVYTGVQLLGDKKSVALKLEFQSADRTLKDAEVNAEIDVALKALEDVGAKLR